MPSIWKQATGRPWKRGSEAETAFNQATEGQHASNPLPSFSEPAANGSRSGTLVGESSAQRAMRLGATSNNAASVTSSARRASNTSSGKEGGGGGNRDETSTSTRAPGPPPLPPPPAAAAVPHPSPAPPSDDAATVEALRAQLAKLTEETAQAKAEAVRSAAAAVEAVAASEAAKRNASTGRTSTSMGRNSSMGRASSGSRHSPSNSSSNSSSSSSSSSSSNQSSASSRQKKSELQYNDNDLETQLRTALNETESLRIQRDSLREYFASAAKERDDLKEQLMASMSETKKALKMQLAAARSEIANLKHAIEATGLGGGLGARAVAGLTGSDDNPNIVKVSAVATMAIDEDSTLRRCSLTEACSTEGGSILKKKTKKKGMRFADAPEVRTFTTDAEVGGETPLVTGAEGEAAGRSSSSGGGGGGGEQGGGATTTLEVFQHKEGEEEGAALPVKLTAQELKRKTSGKWEAKQANLTIVSDLDGTLLAAPKKVGGVLVHPKLGESATYAPLVELLNRGASVVGVTGSRITMHKPRFWDETPLEARKEGRVLLFCETGMVLYRPDPETGEPVEDESYGPFPGNEKRFLSKQLVDKLIAQARLGVKEWFTDLKNDPSMLDAGHWLHGLAEKWSKEDAPVTNDADQTPRIELRGPSDAQVVGVMIAGVPIQYGNKYLAANFRAFKDEIHGQPTGRLCYDCVVPGLSKHLVLKYLLRTGALARGSAFALADSPSGNDIGLTEYHNDGMPFVSVCGQRGKVGHKKLLNCHVGHNEVGSGAFLQQLVDHWDEFGGFHRQAGSEGLLTLEMMEMLASQAAESIEKKNEWSDWPK